MNLNDYNTSCQPNWCPGCGNFGTWTAWKQAAASQNWDNSNTALVAGIGCHGHLVNFTNINSIEGLHGRPLPVATGVKLANNKLNVFVFTGDGDCLAEGGNHFMNTCRRNHDLTIILHDNAIYGLTTGQTSPRTPMGFKSKSTPLGNIDMPLNPLEVAIAAGATFVARVFCMDIPKLTEIIIAANNHKGVALIDVLQPCPSFNPEYTAQYLKENTYYVDDSYDPSNKLGAIEKAMAWGDKQIACGILYQDKKQKSYEELIPFIQDQAVVSLPLQTRDVSSLFNKLT